MVGECGRSRNGTTYNYYSCATRRREHACDKKSVRQDWIEPLVINSIRDLLSDDKNVEDIVEGTWQYYLTQRESQDQVKSLKKQLADVDRAINNIEKAIEAGIFNDATKTRMEELDAQRTALVAAIADFDLQRDMLLSKDKIRCFIEQFRDADLSRIELQKRLIDTFINSVYVYDDLIKINFNFQDGTKTVTLSEVDKANADAEADEKPSSVFVRCLPESTIF
jgi:site-specific DNA recombinase